MVEINGVFKSLVPLDREGNLEMYLLLLFDAISLFDVVRFLDSNGLVFGARCTDCKCTLDDGRRGVLVRRPGAVAVDPSKYTPSPRGVMLWDTSRKGVLCSACFSRAVHAGSVNVAHVQAHFQTVRV